jgi:hypothetical protein
MQVATIVDAPKVSVAQYDQIMDEMGDRIADQALMHFVHKHGDGIRIIEVWPSREVWDEHIAIMRAMAEATGLEFDVEVVPVHRHFSKHQPHK